MKLKAIVVGAGRIGAGYQWKDKPYTHAGAYKALGERVQLCGFVETDPKRGDAAASYWDVPWTPNLEAALLTHDPDIVSVCVQPWEQTEILRTLYASGTRGIWCEKPYWGPPNPAKPTQVNYMRRADPTHREIAEAKHWPGLTLRVTGKIDYHTLCHFQDLAPWWKVRWMKYNIIDGPCSYVVEMADRPRFFDNGGVDAAHCFELMLANLLDHIENGVPLFSPA